MERCAHLLGHIGLDKPPESLYLKVPAPAEAKAREFLSGLEPEGGPAPVTVNITRWAYRPDRLWPARRYRELIETLSLRAGPVVVTHAPADRDWVAGLLQGMTPAPLVFYSKNLKEFAAVIKASRAFITAEGGPMHIAAAVNTPQVVLWGDTPLFTWRPWQARAEIAGARGPVSEIALDEVLAAFERLELKES